MDGQLKVSVQGYGSQRPASSNDNRKGQAENRRVELQFGKE